MRSSHRLLAYSLLLLAWAAIATARAGAQAQQQHRAPNSGLHNPLHRFNVASARWHDGPPKAPSTTTAFSTASSALRLDVQPRTLEGAGGQWFTVTWSGVQDPAEDDLLALYVPADADITQAAPVKFKFCAQESPEHLTTGSGSARFWLINYRQDMAFVLMQGGLDSAVGIARTPAIRVLNPNVPMHIHLARTRDPSQMVVQWTTHSARKPVVRWGPCQAHRETEEEGEEVGKVAAAAVDESLQKEGGGRGRGDSGGRGGSVGGGRGGSVVFIQGGRGMPASRPRPRPLPAGMRNVAHATTLTYTRGEMCGGVANSSGWLNPGLHHRALLTGLRPGRCYQYAVGDDGYDVGYNVGYDGGYKGGYSAVYSFSSAPRPGDAVHILAMADVGQGERDGSNLALKVMQASLNTTRLMADDLRRSASSASSRSASSASSRSVSHPSGHKRAGGSGGGGGGGGSGVVEKAALRDSAAVITPHVSRRLLAAAGASSAGTAAAASAAARPDARTQNIPAAEGYSEEGDSVQGGPVEEDSVEDGVAPPYAYSLLLHEGDLSYAEGFGATWDNFFHQLQPLTAHLPYMVSPGNHERDWPDSGDRWGVEDSGGECGVPYRRRFAMPLPSGRVPGLPGTAPTLPAPHFNQKYGQQRKGRDGALLAEHSGEGQQGRRDDEDEDEDQPWFSFDHGAVHIIHYSTEHDFEPGSPQYAFLESDLRSVDRSVTPWVILAGHRPIYISSNNSNAPDGDQVVAVQLRASLEPLIQRYGVDLTLSGHHHSYQRTCAVFDGVCYDPQGGGRLQGGQGEAQAARSEGQGQAGAEAGREAGATGGVGDMGGNTVEAEVEAVVGAQAEAGAAAEVAAAEVEAEVVHDASSQQGDLLHKGTEEDLQYRGTVHLVIGHGGASLSTNQQQPPPTFLVNSHNTWGYLRLHISRTVLHGEVVSDTDGSLMDELRLTKAEDWGQRYMAARRV